MDRRLNAEEKRWKEESCSKKKTGECSTSWTRLVIHLGPVAVQLLLSPLSAVDSEGNRAEKQLLQIPVLDHSKKSRSRMTEVRRFTNVFSADPD